MAKPSKGSAFTDLEDWEPYRPPWYPNRRRYHNPFAIHPDTVQQGGKTYYSVWEESLAPGELEQLMEASRYA